MHGPVDGATRDPARGPRVTGVPMRPDPSRAGAVLAQLHGLRAAAVEAEEDVLACLVVTGEPRPQRVLDDWLDQVADTARALAEVAGDVTSTLGRYAAPSEDVAAAGSVEAVEPVDPDGTSLGDRS